MDTYAIIGMQTLGEKFVCDKDECEVVGMIVCPNCGGSFDESEPKCPYCGVINEAGAENEYNEKIENIRQRLDYVDDEAKNEYRHQIAIFFKTFGICLIVILGIMALFYAGRMLIFGGSHHAKRAEAVKYMNDLATFNEYEKSWEELYQAGRFEELAKCYDVQIKEVSEYEYEYFRRDFVRVYGYFLQFDEACEEYLESESEYRYTSVLLDFLGCNYYVKNDKYANLSDDDRIALLKLWDGAYERTCEVLSIGFDELDAAIDDAGENYPTYSKCQDFAKERWGK